MMVRRAFRLAARGKPDAPPKSPMTDQRGGINPPQPTSAASSKTPNTRKTLPEGTNSLRTPGGGSEEWLGENGAAEKGCAVWSLTYLGRARIYTLRDPSLCAEGSSALGALLDDTVLCGFVHRHAWMMFEVKFSSATIAGKVIVELTKRIGSHRSH